MNAAVQTQVHTEEVLLLLVWVDLLVLVRDVLLLKNDPRSLHKRTELSQMICFDLL